MRASAGLAIPVTCCIRKKTPKDIGKDWSEFCSRLGDNYPTKEQFNYDHGHAGLGVCVSTGYGDGVYPVFAEYHKGRIARIIVDFID